jgi:hypothetical protein
VISEIMEQSNYQTNEGKMQSIASLNDKIIQNKAKALQDNRPASTPVLQRKANNTGLPNNLKSGIENLSGRLRIKTNENKNSKSVLPLL